MVVSVISEHWKRADQTVEVVELTEGNNITVHIKNGEAIIFPSILAFVQYETAGQETERIYCSEEDLEKIYDLYKSFDDISTEEADKWDRAKNYKNKS